MHMFSQFVFFFLIFYSLVSSINLSQEKEEDLIKAVSHFISLGDYYVGVFKYRKERFFLRLSCTNHSNFHQVENEEIILTYLNSHKNSPFPRLLRSFSFTEASNDHQDESNRTFKALITTFVESDYGNLLDALMNANFRQKMQNESGFKDIFYLNIAQQIRLIHRMGILHLDIKPLNIMIQKDYQPLIVDFGVSFRENNDPEEEESRPAFGSIGFIAPELKFENEFPIPESDWFSFGRTMLFTEITLQEYSTVGGNYHSLDNLIDWLPDGKFKGLIANLTKKAPQDRIGYLEIKKSLIGDARANNFSKIIVEHKNPNILKTNDSKINNLPSRKVKNHQHTEVFNSDLNFLVEHNTFVFSKMMMHYNFANRVRDGTFISSQPGQSSVNFQSQIFYLYVLLFFGFFLMIFFGLKKLKK